MSLAPIARDPSRHAQPVQVPGQSGQQARLHDRRGFPATPMLRKQRLILDRHMVGFVGRGHVGDCPLPRPAYWMVFSQSETSATLSVGTTPGDAELHAAALVVVAAETAIERGFGVALTPGRWYLSSNLRAIAAAITAESGDRPGCALYLRAKGLELVCETVKQLRTAILVPCSGAANLSELETRRLVAARDLIEARLHEALSLNQIARTCGLNRTNLTRGFRLLNGVSVATFIGNARMVHARTLLLTTDLPVATVGFRCGYRSNASFARAFVRHHDVSPISMRAEARG